MFELRWATRSQVPAPELRKKPIVIADEKPSGVDTVLVVVPAVQHRVSKGVERQRFRCVRKSALRTQERCGRKSKPPPPADHVCGSSLAIARASLSTEVSHRAL